MPKNPNLERFDPTLFGKEIRAFLAKNKISTRTWCAMTGASPNMIQRMESGGKDIFVSTVAKYQRIMREYRGDASRR